MRYRFMIGAAMALGIPALSLFPSPLAVPAYAAKAYSARLAFYAQAADISYSGRENSSFSELILSFSFRSNEREGDRYEYGIDFRASGVPSSEHRRQRLSIYEGFAGLRAAKGLFTLKLGQVWLNELGALGSMGGGVAQLKLPRVAGLGRFRLAVFGGLEPKILEPGYASGITKLGGFLSLDGDGARRHVLGYVNVRNSGYTERSVLVVTNYFNLGKSLSVYQAGEYDLARPGGRGRGGLNHFFANVRLSPLKFLEVQGTYRRGRSVDSRVIINNRLDGRPLERVLLEGFLFKSVGGRITLRPASGIHLFAGYAQDQNNRDDEPVKRTTFGVFASNLFKSGLDVYLTDSRMSSKNRSSYDSWYASIGRNLTGSFYLEAFYNSSLVFFRLSGAGGIILENRPRTNRFGLSVTWNAWRMASLLLTAERVKDEAYGEYRIFSGLSYRF